MKRKLFGGLLFTAVMCLIMCTVVMAEDVPMTEEEIINVEESFSVETEAEEVLIVAEEEEFLEADGLVEDDEVLEAAEDFDFDTAIPDPAFRSILDARHLTTLESISNELDLSVVTKAIDDLTGIKYFTKLRRLACQKNRLTKLDVSGLSSLKELYCYNNYLTNLNVSGCTALESLNCKDNQLTSLDVSTCTALTKLDCSGNQLKTLDVSFCPNLNKTNLTVDDTTRILLTHEHVWDGGKVTKKATTTAEGVKTYTCTIKACGQTKTEKIPKLKPTAPTEKNTISKKPSIKKPAAAKGKITVKWKHFKHTSKKAKKIWKKIKKVQVQCATDKACKNIVKDVKVSRGKTKYAIKGLKKKTTYYVRVRYFDGVGYSKWSKVKKVKTK